MRALTGARRAGMIGSIVAMGVVLATLGCKDLNVPNYTSADIGLLENNPDASVINLMSTGLLRGIRSGHEALETYGRDAYNLDPTEVRSVTVPLIGPIASGGYWSYGEIRNCYAILGALDKVGTLMTAQQKEGVRGFVKTIMAYHFHAILRVRYQHGAFIDVNRDKFGPLAPHANGKAVLDHIIALLDTADTHLAAAAVAPNTFSFALTRGFQVAEGGVAFNTPSTFRAFNRALKARVEVYAASPTWDAPNAAAHWTAALAAITAASAQFQVPATPASPGASPVVALATLNNGPKHTYGPSTADGLNTLYDNTGRQRYAHPSLRADAQLNGATQDNRVVRKTIDMGTCKGILGLCSNWRWNIPSNTTPIPIIRTEELILLRAEANLGLGNTSAAIGDINLIRVNSGQLTQISDPYVATGTQPALLLDEVLYEKRYSLVYEFGHRWVDLARYGKLLTLPRDAPTHRIWPALPFDETECNFRRAENLSGCPIGGEGGI